MIILNKLYRTLTPVKENKNGSYKCICLCGYVNDYYPEVILGCKDFCTRCSKPLSNGIFVNTVYIENPQVTHQGVDFGGLDILWDVTCIHGESYEEMTTELHKNGFTCRCILQGKKPLPGSVVGERKERQKERYLGELRSYQSRG